MKGTAAVPRPARRRRVTPRGRVARIRRTTRETDVAVRVRLEGRGAGRVATGIGFLDHMLRAFALHGGIDLDLRARGDREVDQHHLVEDCGIVLGRAIHRALRGGFGIERAGFFAFPMEESLAVVAIDLGGRPSLVYRARLRRTRVGDLESDTVPEFLRGFCRGLGADLHVVVPHGWNDHHKAEAIFKALGKALKIAVSRDGRYHGLVPSTKGSLG